MKENFNDEVAGKHSSKKKKTAFRIELSFAEENRKDEQEMRLNFNEGKFEAK